MGMIRKTMATAMAGMLLLGTAQAEVTISSALEKQDVDVANDEVKTIFTITPGTEDFTWALFRLEDGEWQPVTEELESGSAISGSGSADGGAVEIGWDYWYNGDWTAADGGVQHRLEVTVGDEVVNTADFYVNFFSQRDYDRVSLVSWEERDDGTVAPSEEEWYVDNTVCVFGPALKDVKPGVTGKWYTAAVVDLSVQGTQRFDLIGAGAWKLGTVTVTVEGDEAVVTYQCTEDLNTMDTWDDITAAREFVMLWPDADAIDTVDPAQIESPFTFGEPFSITESLGGQMTAILYVNNMMTYGSHSPHVTRFWPNLAENAAIRQAMADLLAE